MLNILILAMVDKIRLILFGRVDPPKRTILVPILSGIFTILGFVGDGKDRKWNPWKRRTTK